MVSVCSRLTITPMLDSRPTTDFVTTMTGLLPLYVWAYNARMEIVNFPEINHAQVGARGICPHCGDQSYFAPVSTYMDVSSPTQRVAGACRCQSCKGFILVVGWRNSVQHGQNSPFYLSSVFPFGKPNDAVDPSVPKGIASDFSEALRCQWIKAYKATVVMCRRAVQASAVAMGAPRRKKLDAQIDMLFERGKITEALKDFAHEVRLTGNVGAHPDTSAGQQNAAALVPDEQQSEEGTLDGLEEVTEKDASDIVEFTREYLHHIYVMPAKLAARRQPKK